MLSEYFRIVLPVDVMVTEKPSLTSVYYSVLLCMIVFDELQRTN